MRQNDEPSADRVGIVRQKIGEKVDMAVNAFSLLALQEGDDLHNLGSSTSTGVSGDPGNTGKCPTGKLAVENGEKKEQHSGVSLTEYKLPLVWFDFEMTGLNIEVDRILEIACIIADGNLSKSVEGPDLVIHQSQECLDKMGDWCQEHHGASGLTKKVLKSTINEREAEKQVIEFVKRHVGAYTPLLAGNSVYVDYLFLKKYMPDLDCIFPHVLVDVSSVKALCMRWYPRAQRKAPRKENRHRAMDDIRESIMELKYYKENIFKASKK